MQGHPQDRDQTTILTPLRSLSILASLVLLVVSGVGFADDQQTTSVQLGDFFFCEKSAAGACETVITSGDTVVWDYAEGSAGHTVTFCGESCDEPTGSPLFDSGKLLAGETFSFTFNEPGELLYYCEFHPVAMRGSVLVQPRQASPRIQPTPTAVASPISSTANAPTPSSSPTFTGNGPESAATDDGDSQIWLIVPIAAGAALAVLGVSLFAFRRSRGQAE